jgi:predicted dehydrogenase
MIRIALIGCGRIATRHSELLGNNLIKNAKLVSVCDINISKAKKIGEKFSIPYYQDMYKMILNEDIDIIVILTPSGLHAQHTISLAKYKKHIIVEKPMALTLEDADAMIQECTKNGIKLFVVKQNRYNLPVLQLKKALNKERFGKLVLGTVRVRWCRTQEYYDQDTWRGTWKFDGGVLTNQASHHIDLLEWCMGEVESVFAKSTTALVNIETEDTAIVTLKFKNGALGIIEATTAIRPKDLEGSISILGEKGSVEIGGFAVNEIKHWNFQESIGEDKDIDNFSVNPPDIYGFGHKAYYDDIIECLNNNKKASVDGEEGKKSLRLITAIYQSIETGKEVFLNSKLQESKLGKQ